MSIIPHHHLILAGRSYAASVEEIDPAVFDEIFRLNVLGPIVAMQAVIPPMRTQGGGSHSRGGR